MLGRLCDVPSDRMPKELISELTTLVGKYRDWEEMMKPYIHMHGPGGKIDKHVDTSRCCKATVAVPGRLAFLQGTLLNQYNTTTTTVLHQCTVPFDVPRRTVEVDPTLPHLTKTEQATMQSLVQDRVDPTVVRNPKSRSSLPTHSLLPT